MGNFHIMATVQGACVSTVLVCDREKSKVITLQRHHLGVVATTTIENYARPFVVMGELMN